MEIKLSAFVRWHRGQWLWGQQVDLAGPDYIVKVWGANFSLGGGAPVIIA